MSRFFLTLMFLIGAAASARFTYGVWMWNIHFHEKYPDTTVDTSASYYFAAVGAIVTLACVWHAIEAVRGRL